MIPMAEWLRSGAYLPPRLRDFHDQKDIFKWIWRRVEKRIEADASARSYLAGMNWTAAQVFVIDHFLWWMAMHGYTLQRSRARRDDYCDWDASVRAMKDEDMTVFKKTWAGMAEPDAPSVSDTEEK